MWTYYQEIMPSGGYRLYRVDERREAQSFHREKGWISTDQFFHKMQTGDLDSSDIVDDERAAALADASKTRGDLSKAASGPAPLSMAPTLRASPSTVVGGKRQAAPRTKHDGQIREA